MIKKLFLLYAFAGALFFPNSLNGKKILLNGPEVQKGRGTEFDGNGYITSVVFKDNNAIVSELIIPDDRNLVFPLSDFVERDYFRLLLKYIYSFFVRTNIQSGTRNTIVLKYKNTLYAAEETCKPLKLFYDEDYNICIAGESRSSNRMGAHMLEDNTIFSYNFFEKYPIRINNTKSIPWTPFKFKYPVMIHDGVKTCDDKYYIFPLSSTGLGKVDEYINKKRGLPFDSKLRKAGFLIYNREMNNCSEVFIDEYVDMFHIPKIVDLGNNIHKLYLTFISNFTEWMNDNSTRLGIDLKEVIIDINNSKISEIYNTGIHMDFINEYSDVLIGSSLSLIKPQAIFYNTYDRSTRYLDIPGEIVREIVPYNGMLLYFSHEKNLTKTFLYAVTMKDGTELTKIEVPNRPPGMHTTMY